VGNDFHGTDDQLEQYALGRLPDSDLPRLEEHLLVCTTCREKLNGISDFALGMREALDATAASAPAAARGAGRAGWVLASFFRHPAFSMALAFAALLVVVGVFSNSGTKLAPRAAIQLTAVRGEMPVALPAREFDLTLADGPREGGPFRVEVLNAGGMSMWTGLVESGPEGVPVKVTQPLPQGDYFVRLYSVSGKVLREYGFRIRA
jgi:hypothetical protein